MTRKNPRKKRPKPPSPARLRKETRSLGARFIEIMCRLDQPGCECAWCRAKHPYDHFPTCKAQHFILEST